MKGLDSNRLLFGNETTIRALSFAGDPKKLPRGYDKRWTR
jgi:hypothetical protein